MGEKNGPPTHVCPKCEGPMEPGRLMGMKFTSFVADAEWAKPVGKAVRVTAYRCQRCGYCEIYAQGSP